MRSAQMLAHEAGNLEHRDLVLAEHGSQLGVGVDAALVGGVLQAVGLDVVPQLLDHLRARDQTFADDGRQRRAGLFAAGSGGFARGLGRLGGGGFFGWLAASWNPLSHNQYWQDKDVISALILLLANVATR